MGDSGFPRLRQPARGVAAVAGQVRSGWGLCPRPALPAVVAARPLRRVASPRNWPSREQGEDCRTCAVPTTMMDLPREVRRGLRLMVCSCSLQGQWWGMVNGTAMARPAYHAASRLLRAASMCSLVTGLRTPAATSIARANPSARMTTAINSRLGRAVRRESPVSSAAHARGRSIAAATVAIGLSRKARAGSNFNSANTARVEPQLGQGSPVTRRNWQANIYGCLPTC